MQCFSSMCFSLRWIKLSQPYLTGFSLDNSAHGFVFAFSSPHLSPSSFLLFFSFYSGSFPQNSLHFLLHSLLLLFLIHQYLTQKDQNFASYVHSFFISFYCICYNKPTSSSKRRVVFLYRTFCFSTAVENSPCAYLSCLVEKVSKHTESYVFAITSYCIFCGLFSLCFFSIQYSHTAMVCLIFATISTRPVKPSQFISSFFSLVFFLTLSSS